MSSMNPENESLLSPEPSHPPGLPMTPSNEAPAHQLLPPTPTDGFLTVDIPSATSSSASSPVVINHADAAPPILLKDGCDPPHVVPIDDMDPSLLQDLVRDPKARFVTTTSPEAAKELRKRFNQAHQKREPEQLSFYVLTRFTNQYGKPAYRVEPRGQDAPAASGAEIAERMTMAASSTGSIPHSPPPKTKIVKNYRSILNIRSSNNVAGRHTASSSIAESSGSRGQASGSIPHPHHGPGERNRLRKSRSNSDFGGIPSPGASVSSRHGTRPETPSRRQHSHTVSGADLPSQPIPRIDTPAMGPRPVNIPAALRPSGSNIPLDLLGVVMQDGTRGSASPSLMSPSGSIAPSLDASLASYAVSQEGGSSGKGTSANPFGPGVAFDCPQGSMDVSEPPSPSHLARFTDGEDTPNGLMSRRMNATLRVMQSFESGMTARAGDHLRHQKSFSGLGMTLDPQSEEGMENHTLGLETELSDEEPKGPARPIVPGALFISGDLDLELQSNNTEAVRTSISSLQQLAAPGSLFLASTDLIEQPTVATADVAAELQSRDDAASISTTNSSNTHTLPASVPDTPRYRLSPATAAYTGIWNVDTFDVIQTSRGLPIIGDEIMLHDRDRVLQISIEGDNSALPKNDPRFVIWGDLHPLKTLGSHASGTSVHGPGPARVLANSDSTGRLRSNSASTQVSSAPSQTSSGGDISNGKVIVAASIERWIAQLTSEIRTDELLVFFLTYRIYLDGITLAQLLITRFHWTLDQSSTPQDADMRKIVRVRTFVAFKFWIQKFFTVDFAESVMLRRTISGWLNTLRKDQVVQHYPGLHSMLNKLVSTIKAARDEFERDHPNRARRSTTRSNKEKEHPDDGSDLEADFLGESTGDRDEAPAFQSLVFKDGPNDRTVVLAVPSIAAGAHLPPGVTVVPSASALTATFATTTPVPTNALTRALTNTFGRMGRWRRALSTRSDAHPVIAPAAKVSAFDIELTWDNAEFHGRPVAAHGGTSHLPRPILHPVAVAFSPAFAPADPSPAVSVPPNTLAGVAADAENAGAVPILQPVAEAGEDGSDGGHLTPDETSSVVQADETTSQTVAADSEDTHSITTPEAASSTQISPKSSIISQSEAGQSTQSETLQHPSFDDAPSYRSSFASSRFSYQSGASDGDYHAPPGLQPIKTVDIGGGNWRSRFAADDYNNEYDEYDDSDEEPTGAAVRGKLQQTKRRMPRRGDFELVRHRESASSYGAPSRSSVISSGSDQGHPGQMPLGILHQWQLNALVDEFSDDEGVGDRETALQKLQGQIRDNPEQARQKDVQLEGWLQHIRERQAAGDWQDEAPRFPKDDDSDEEDYGQAPAEDAAGDNVLLVPPPDNDGDAITPLAEVPPPLTTQLSAISHHSEEGRPPVEEAVPLEILQSRVTPDELPQSKRNSRETAASSSVQLPAPRTSFVTKLTYHKSFVLELPSLVVAQHFAMIDRELFLAIKFEELTDTDSLPQTAEANFLDWTQFLKDRALARAERRFGNITMSLVAVRARFNLLAGFVVSEILLAHPNDRAAVHSKFLRIAWKSQQIKSFGTLVAIMSGLDSEWVRRAMKQHYGRLVSSDRTIFTVLKRWVTSEGDFTFIKGEVAKLQEVKMGRPHAASIASVHSENAKRPSEACASEGAIPFIGIYLSQMRQIGEMPNLVDPTAPREVIDWTTDPRHPEVFAALAPLPPSTPLKALINVQKQRRIAAVIQSLVAGQHLAARVQYAVDRKVYQRCLKIRALSYEQLQNAVDAQGL